MGSDFTPKRDRHKGRVYRRSMWHQRDENRFVLYDWIGWNACTQTRRIVRNAETNNIVYCVMLAMWECIRTFAGIVYCVGRSLWRTIKLFLCQTHMHLTFTFSWNFWYERYEYTVIYSKATLSRRVSGRECQLKVVFWSVVTRLHITHITYRHDQWN